MQENLLVIMLLCIPYLLFAPIGTAMRCFVVHTCIILFYNYKSLQAHRTSNEEKKIRPIVSDIHILQSLGALESISSRYDSFELM